MDAIQYLKEKERLTKCSRDSDCVNCRLDFENNKFNVSCDVLEGRYPEEAIRIIEEWSKEINWSTIEIDTRLLVSNDGCLWHKRHFATYENNKVYVYEQGCSSYTTKQIEPCKYAKLWDENC